VRQFVVLGSGAPGWKERRKNTSRLRGGWRKTSRQGRRKENDWQTRQKERE
jgi:hypothetical protein